MIPPLEQILLAADDIGLTGLWFMEHSRYHAEGLQKDAVQKELPVFEDTKRWLDLYFQGKDPGFTPKLHLVGSDFRNRVGEIMLEIPFGATVTYGDIARRIAQERGLSTMPSQAVGGEVGHNPISIIVPCHRVVGSGGSVTGYGSGVHRKEALLKLEGAQKDSFTVPTKGTVL